MVCLDTDIMVALLRGDKRALDVIDMHSNDQVKTTIITAYELLKGASISSRRDENIRMVMELLQNVTVLALDVGACRMAGLIYSKLRERGRRMIGEFDILIAGIVKHNRELLITRDMHFQAIPDMSVEVW
ncbi:MAG: type II toxin-antitoxin system VapC family toxin [Candidatus Nitrosocaldus sp.]|nr:type II toxin-antitoxin system VapC family toxin [Candidatus Nitrosocaldus sp.]